MNRNQAMKRTNTRHSLFSLKHPLRSLTAATVGIAVLLSFAAGGCGGGGKSDNGSQPSGAASPSGTRGTGKVTMTIIWPVPEPSRLIPDATSTITIAFQKDSLPVIIQSASVAVGAATLNADGTVTVPRPAGDSLATDPVTQTTVTLELPAGENYVASVTARDGTSTKAKVAELAGVNVLAINEGTNPLIPFNLASTITQLNTEVAGVTAATGTVPDILVTAGTVAENVAVAAKNTDNVPAAITPSKIKWTPETSAYFSVAPDATNANVFDLRWQQSTYRDGISDPVLMIAAQDTESTVAVQFRANILPSLVGEVPDTGYVQGDEISGYFDLGFANEFILSSVKLQEKTGNSYNDVTLAGGDLTVTPGPEVGNKKRFELKLTAPSPKKDTKTYRFFATPKDTTLAAKFTNDFIVTGVNLTNATASRATLLAGDINDNLTADLNVSVQNGAKANISYKWTLVPASPDGGSLNADNVKSVEYTPPADIATPTLAVTATVTASINGIAFDSAPVVINILKFAVTTPITTTLFVVNNNKIQNLFTSNVLSGYAVDWDKLSGNGTVDNNGEYTPSSPTTAGEDLSVQGKAEVSNNTVASANIPTFKVRLLDTENAEVGVTGGPSSFGKGDTLLVKEKLTYQFKVIGGFDTATTGYTPAWSRTEGPGTVTDNDKAQCIYTVEPGNVDEDAEDVTIRLTLSHTTLPDVTREFKFKVQGEED